MQSLISTAVIIIISCLLPVFAERFSEEFLSSGLIHEIRSKRATNQGSADSFVDFEFVKEPQDVVSAVKDSDVRFDCVGRASASSKGKPGGEGSSSKGAIKIQWRKDGGPVGRASNGARTSVLQNGSLVITKVGSSASDVDEGFYQCSAVVDDQWTFVSRKAKLALASLSRFDDQPDDRNALAGETVSLPCRIQSNPPPVITWYRDNEPIDQNADNKRIIVIPKSGSLEIRNVQAQDQAAYKCKADNGEKHRFSKEGRLRVAKNPLTETEPKFEIQPKGQVVKAGGALVLECAANGQPEPEIRWMKDQKPLDLSTSGRLKRLGQNTLQIEKSEVQDAGIYTCRVNNSEGSIEASATVEIQEPPSFVKVPKNAAAKETADAEFECETKGRPGPAVTWLKNGEVLVASEYFSIEGTKLKILGLVKSDQGVYQCVADNEAGSSQTSAQLLVEVAETPQTEGSGGEVPTEPLGLKTVKVGSRAATIRWDPPLQTRGDLKGYSVFYKQNGSDRERLINVSATAAREVVISRLQPSTTFFFRVVAFNKNGAGLSSAPLKVATPIEQGVPGKVISFRGTSLSPTVIELRWEPPLGDEPVGYYRIIYSMDAEDAKSAKSSIHHSDEDDEVFDDDDDDGDDETEIQVQTTSYTMHALEEFTKYRFRIEAVNNNGAGPSSDSIVVQTDTDAPSGPPINVTVMALTADSVMIRWAPPIPKQRNGEITSYKIRYKYRDRGSRGHVVSVEGPELQHVLPNLERGEAYLIRVAAVTAKGQGPYSAWIPVEMTLTDHTNDESQPPGAPTSLRLQARSNEVLVYWTPPLDDGLVIRGYLIGWGINMPDIKQARVEATERFFAIKELKPSREYVISLRAYNNLGNGFPIYETVRTLDASPPGPARYLETPMGLRATGISSTTIQLSWTWSDRDTPPDVKPTYTVRYNPTGGRVKEINTTDLSLVIDGLKPDQQYEFAVKSSLGRMESPWSMTTSTKSLSAAPTSYPRDLTIIRSTEAANGVIVTWQPPKHPNGKITHYLIYYSSDLNMADNLWKMEQVRGDRMAASITNLQADTEYYFKIQAFNDRGYSPISPVKSHRIQTSGSSMRSGGGGGRQFQSPNDDARRKTSGEWNGQNGKNDQLTPGSRTGSDGGDSQQADGIGGLPKQTVIIIISGAALVAIVAVIIAAVVLCKRRYRSRSAAGYTAGKKTGGGGGPPVGADSKPPPDLWIHHDHSLELRNVGNPSTQDFKQRSPSPPATELLEQPTPRYHSLATMPTGTGTLSRSYHHHQSSNSVDVPRPYPPAKAPPPQVVYTGPKMTINRDGSSSPYGSAGTVGVLTPTPPPQLMASKSMLDQTPRPMVTATGNPLKSFTALTSPPPPPPVGPASSRTHLIRHVPPMVNQSPKPKPAGIVIGTKARAMQARPSQGSDTAYSSGKETDNELPRSYSTEELNAQMQNLDSLMKDLNAISANEFEG